MHAAASKSAVFQILLGPVLAAAKKSAMFIFFWDLCSVHAAAKNYAVFFRFYWDLCKLLLKTMLFFRFYWDLCKLLLKTMLFFQILLGPVHAAAAGGQPHHSPCRHFILQ